MLFDIWFHVQGKKNTIYAAPGWPSFLQLILQEEVKPICPSICPPVHGNSLQSIVSSLSGLHVLTVYVYRFGLRYGVRELAHRCLL